jgi:hypothetical protein
LMRRICVLSLAMAATMLLISPESAAAYVGPGAGLTVIGAALALIGSIVLGIVGFIWYPIKRILRARAKKDRSVGPTQ